MRASLVSRPWAGLDIGSFSVKLFALRPGMGRVKVLAAEVPHSAGGGPDASPEVLARAVMRCAERAGARLHALRGVTVGIAGPDVIVKQIQLPLMDEAEVGAALRFEARKHLPFDPQAMVMDHQVLGRHAVDHRLDVLLAAVSREHLDRCLLPLARLGLEADIVDATPLALTNAAAHAGGGERGAHFLLDIGQGSSHLTLYQRGEPYFSRRLDFGGAHVTRAIAASLGVAFEDAERWKLAAGSGAAAMRADWSGRELRAVHEALASDLVDEIRRSLAFYRTIGHLPDPLRLLVSGGTARLPGLSARLGGLLEFPVSVLDPFESLGGAARAGVEGGPQYAQAVGLALRNA